MMQGAVDLLDSERGVFALAVLLAATVLAALGTLPPADWLGIIKWIGITLIAGKTVTTAVQTVVDNKDKRERDAPNL